ncbi:MAG: hypothetical protein AAGA35_03455 [Patescibacteria group bacterium]
MRLSRQYNRILLTSATVLLTLGSFFLIQVATAQTNPQINYQGKLTDTTGAAVTDGTYNMRFWLLQSLGQATTSAVFTEELTGSNQVQITNGLFSVMLGSTTDMSSVDFNQTLYLGVEVGGTGGSPTWDGEMSPRKILGSVPAAFEARQLGGVASSSFLRSDQADSATGLLTFLGGASTTELIAGTSTLTRLVIDGETFTSFTGSDSGLINNAGTLTANISESNLNIAGGPTDDYVLQASSTAAGGFVWTATSSLGFSSQTLTLGSDNQIPFVNSGGTDLEYSSGLTFDGAEITIGGNINVNSDSGHLAFSGTEVLSASTTRHNYLFGVDAGALLNGDSNQILAFGNNALSSGTSTSGMIAIGENALSSVVTGGGIVAIGSNGPLRNLEGAFQVVAIGDSAGQDINTTGNSSSRIVLIGHSAARYNTSGAGNTIIGAFAGDGNAASGWSGGANTIVGAGAGGALIGSNTGNTFVGNLVGDEHLTGSSNIVIGNDIDTPTTTASETLNIGNLLFGTDLDGRDYTLSTGGIAIGTTTGANARLTVQSQGTTDILNLFETDGAEVFSVAESGDAFIAGSLGIGTTSTQYQIDVGAFSTGDKIMRLASFGGFNTGFRLMENSDSTGFSVQYNGDASANQFQILRHNNNQAGVVSMVIERDDGNVGIGTTSPTRLLSVAGDAIITGALYDNSNSAGSNGMVLQSDGSGFSWVATSSLGIASGGSSLFTDGGDTTYLTSFSDNFALGTTSGRARLSVSDSNLSSTWTAVGTTTVIAGSDAVELTLLSPNRIVYTTNGGGGGDDEIQVYEYNGTTWNQIGTGFNLGAIGVSAHDVISPNRIAYIAGNDNDLRVYEFDGTSWTEIGNQLAFSDGAFFNSSLTTLSPNRIAYINESTDELRTYEFDGSNWSQVGTSLDLGSITQPDITALGPRRIAYLDEVGDELRTYEFDGSNWSQVGTATPLTAVTNPSITTISPNRIAVTDGNNDTLGLYELRDGSWTLVGTTFSFGSVFNPEVLWIGANRVLTINGTSNALQIYQFSEPLFLVENTASGTPFFSISDNGYTEAESIWINDTLRVGRRAASSTDIVLEAFGDSYLGADTTIAGDAVIGGVDNPAYTRGLTVANGGQEILASTITGIGSITDGSNGATRLNGAREVVVQGQYAYVLSGIVDDGLQIIDISDPTNPVGIGAVSNATTLSAPRGLAVRGNYAYIASQADYFTVVDIADPTAPEIVAAVLDGTNGTDELDGATDVVVVGNYAYIVSLGDDGLQIIDISDPTNPVGVGSITDGSNGVLLDGAQNIVVRGNYAYIVANNDDALQIIDISDPTNPVGVGSTTDTAAGIDELNGASDLALSGNFAYVSADLDLGVQIIDISDPTNPVGVGSVGDSTFSGIEQIEVAGNYVYITVVDGLKIIDISSSTNPVIVRSIDDGEYAADRLSGADGLAVVGNYAYVTSDTEHALQILDLQSFTTPTADIGNLLTETIQTGNLLANDLLTVNGFFEVGGSSYIQGSLTVGGTASSALMSATSPILTADYSGIGIGTSSPARLLSVAGDAIITGALYDNANSAGSNGMVLQSTGSGFNWVATSSLGIGGSSLLTDSGDTTFLTSITDNFALGTSTDPTLFVNPSERRVSVGSTSVAARFGISDTNLGQSWEQVGETFSLSVGTADISSLSSNRVVVHDSSDNLKVLEFTGSEFVQVGTDFSLSAGTDAFSVIDTNRIAFTDATSDELRTYEFDGTTWSQVGSALSINGFAGNAVMTTLSPNRIVFSDATNDDLTLYEFDGDNWSQVGNALTSGITAMAGLTALSPNRVVYMDNAVRVLRVFDFDGTNWNKVGVDFSITGVGVGNMTTLSSNRVATIDEGNDQLAAYEFDGTTWSQVGDTFPLGSFTQQRGVTSLSPNLVVVALSGLTAYRFSEPLFLVEGSASSTPYFSVSDGGYALADVLQINDTLRVGLLAASSTQSVFETYGKSFFGDQLTVQGNLYLASTTALATTTNSLYNQGGTLFFNGSEVGGGLFTDGGTFSYLTDVTEELSIGTTTIGNAKLTIQSEGTSDILSLFETDGTEVFTVLENGNVGIGSTTPTALLSVGGDALINGLTVGLGGGQITSNTALGNNALVVNTSGTQNTAVGSGALQSNLTGNSHTAFGAGALASTTDGFGKTAFGQNALANHTASAEVSAFGTGALFNNIDGTFHTALGTYSLLTATSGTYNTAVGHRSLVALQSGSFNTAVGGRSMWKATTNAENNTSLGYQTLSEMTTGSNNVAIGFNAGNTITTGSNNILLGYDVDTPAVDTSDYLNIGNTIYGDLSTNFVGIGTSTDLAAALNIQSTGSNDILNLFETDGTEVFTVLENGNVGVGTSTPDTALSVSGLAKTSGTTGDVGFVVDYEGGKSSALTAGTLRSAFLFDDSGSFSIQARPAADVLTGTADAADTVFEILANGNVGIGSSSPSQLLSIGDEAYFNNLGNLIFTSSSVIDAENTLTIRAGTLNRDVTINNQGFTYTGGDLSVIFDSEGKVGIGTTSPQRLLEIQAVAADDAVIRLTDDDTTLNDGNLVGRLEFVSVDADNNGVGAFITARAEDSLGNLGLEFGTGLAGAASIGMVLDASGNVGIGTTTPNQLLSVVGDSSFTGDLSIRGKQTIAPSDVTLISTTSISGTAGAFSFEVYGDYAYVAGYSGSGGFDIFNIADPDNMQLVSNTPYTSQARDIEVAGNYIYVIHEAADQMRIYDATDKTNVELVGTFDPGDVVMNSPKRLIVRGDRAYITAFNSDSLVIVDIADPTNPSLIGYTVLDDASGFDVTHHAIQGQYAYVARNQADGIDVVDMSDPTAPTTTGKWRPNDTSVIDGPEHLGVKGNYAYVLGRQSDTITVVDISDPTAPTTTAVLASTTAPAFFEQPVGITFSDNYAYVSGLSSTTAIIDISDPANPSFVQVVDTSVGGLNAYEVVVVGNTLYRASQQSGGVLSAWDLGGFETPTAEIGSLVAGNLQVDMAYIDQQLHVLGGITTGADVLIGGGLTVQGNASTSLFSTATSTAFSVVSGFTGLGTSTANSLLEIDRRGMSGAGTFGIDQYLVTENSVENAVQFGNRYYLNASNTATTTIVGTIMRVEDDTLFGNTVRALEVQADRGVNTLGENTALSGFARTFGVRGTTRGDAGGDFEPAGGFFQTEGTTQGNAIRGYSNDITTSELLQLFQDTSTFAGTGLLMNFGNSGGTFNATTSKFVDFQNAGTSKFTVTAHGTTTIGDGTTNFVAGLQIGYGGLCVDNDGSCVASTTGKITAVSYGTNNSDLAEMYFSDDELEPGEVVVLESGLSVTRATGAEGERILGVVSTKPGITMGADDTSLIAGQQGFPIGLTGRVPVKLSTENGPITKGDPLMLSSLPGVAMKAVESGTIVGYALEDFDGEQAYSEGFVNQFGDDVAEPNFVPLNVNDDPRINDGCYFGGGVATGEEEDCTETEAVVDEINEENLRREAEALIEAIEDLVNEEAEEVELDEETTVQVGQVLMFINLSQYRVDREAEFFAELFATSTNSEGGEETVWDKLQQLANAFVDGFLVLTGIRVETVTTDELCVGSTCVSEAQLIQLLEQSNNEGQIIEVIEEPGPDLDDSDNSDGVSNDPEPDPDPEPSATTTEETGTTTETVGEPESNEEPAATTTEEAVEEEPATDSEESTEQTEAAEDSPTDSGEEEQETEAEADPPPDPESEPEPQPEPTPEPDPTPPAEEPPV